MLVLTTWLWTTAVSGVLLLALLGVQRLLLGPASAPRSVELPATTSALTGSAVPAAEEDRVAQAA